MLPGSRYSVRVRSLNNFGVLSNWSEAIEVAAPSSSDAVAAVDPTTYGPLQTSRSGYYVRVDDGLESAAVFFKLPGATAVGSIAGTIDGLGSNEAQLEVVGPNSSDASDTQPKITLISGASGSRTVFPTGTEIDIKAGDNGTIVLGGEKVVSAPIQVGGVWLARPPHVIVTSSTPDSIPDDGGLHELSFDDVFHDSTADDFTIGSIHIGAANGGLYRMTATVVWDADSTGHRLLEIYDEAESERFILDVRNAVTDPSVGTYQSGEAYRVFETGGSMCVRVRQASGGSLDCRLVRFALEFISPV